MDFEEIDNVAKKYVELRDGVDKKEYLEYQKICIKKLSPLVNSKVSKYKKFPNYFDLQQDAFEALLLAFETYNPNKGSFSWWATKYIETRVSRSANAHSTIKIPIKKAKTLTPYKTNSMPLMIDSANPLDYVETDESNKIIEQAISQLSSRHKQIIKMYYGFNDNSEAISNISKELNISRPMCVRLLGEAEKVLKNKLKRYFV